MKKKATKKSAPAKKAVEPKLKVVKKIEKDPIVKDVNALLAQGPVTPKPLSKAEMARRKKAYLAEQKEMMQMMENHQKAVAKKKEEEFSAAFKKATKKIEIYLFEDDKTKAITSDMRQVGFKHPIELAGVLASMLGKVTK
jgi:hypothetical protein